MISVAVRVGPRRPLIMAHAFIAPRGPRRPLKTLSDVPLRPVMLTSLDKGSYEVCGGMITCP